MAIGGKIVDRAGGDASFHRGLGDGAGHDADQTRIKGLGDKIFSAKGQLFALISCGCFGRRGRAGKSGDTVNARDLHFVVDRGRAHIKCTAKDERKT